MLVLVFNLDSCAEQKWFLALAAIAIAVHAVFTILAGPNRLTFLSGGSDAPAYSLLASNLLHHYGYSYAGQPTALRPPGYPLFLAAMSLLFGRWYITATRVVQFLTCIATACLCGRTAKELFNARVGKASFILTLFLPTQIFASAQILTECLASFFVALFLYFLVREMSRPATGAEAGMGLAAGLATLLRFNSAALPLITGIPIFFYQGKRRWMAITGSMVLPLVLVSPWLVRNLAVFHGQVVLSTQAGVNALQGVLTPEGRTQPGDTQKLFRAVGWVLSEVETNNPSRLRLPPEPVLDRQCWSAVPGLWKSLGWRALPLLVKKVSDFWFSTDQIFDTASLGHNARFLRLAGVIVYWCILALACAGWRELHKRWPTAANVLLVYAATFTVLHLPLVMSTRIRFPLMDPLVGALAGGGFVYLLSRIADRQHLVLFFKRPPAL